MRKNSSNGGYMWLLLLVIGSVLVVVIMVQGGFFSGSKEDGNVFDKAKGAIDDAKETKENLENKYKFDPEEQERSLDNMN